MHKLHYLASTLAIALLFGGASAQAQISPNPVSFTLEGDLTLTTTTTLNCPYEIDFYVYSGGTSGQVTGFRFLNPFCSTMLSVDYAYGNILKTTPGEFSVNHVRITTVWGQLCDLSGWRFVGSGASGFLSPLSTYPGSHSNCSLFASSDFPLGGTVVTVS